MDKLDTKEKLIEDTFNSFLKNPSVAVILVNQHVINKNNIMLNMKNRLQKNT